MNKLAIAVYLVIGLGAILVGVIKLVAWLIGAVVDG